MEQTMLDEFTYLLFYRCPDGRCSHSYTRLNECYHEMEMFILTEFIPANNSSTDIEVHKDEFSITCKLDGKEYVFSVVAYELGKQLDINKLSTKYML